MKNFSIILVGHVNTWDTKPIYTLICILSRTTKNTPQTSPRPIKLVYSLNLDSL